MKADVIVVGAGPAGLMLAGELRLGGAEVVVYEKLAAATGQSRALGFTRRTAEVLDQRGLLTRLGPVVWGPQGHFGGVRIDLRVLAENYNGALGLSQARTEQVLERWLAELDVPIRRGYEATGFREIADGVVVSFDGPDGRHEAIADYLVGCDGARSTIRALAGIKAPGWGATRCLYTAEVTGVDLRPRPIGERLPGGNMVLCASLPDGRFRIVIHDKSLPVGLDPAALTFGEVADAWQRLTGESIHHGQADWLWACDNAAGLAAEYRRGRVFLAGDAAHAIPPLAAWGLSTGVQDAVNLGWKLAAVVTGRAPDRLLDTYHSERHPIGQQLIRNVQAASMLYLGGDEMEPLRSVLGDLVAYKDAARLLAGLVSGLSIRYDMGPGEHSLLGMRLSPDHEVDRADGTRIRVAELLHPARGVFIATSDRSEAAHVVARWGDRIDIVTGRWVPAPVPSGPAAPEEVLIRPDGYIAWAAPGGCELSAALISWFGSAGALAAAGTRA